VVHHLPPLLLHWFGFPADEHVWLTMLRLVVVIVDRWILVVVVVVGGGSVYVLRQYGGVVYCFRHDVVVLVKWTRRTMVA